ncbi:SH3 domain-containing protein [uncultured Fluviicola sp.]|uniref:SH3 domain-containing protein n=1 Tax=uncultured Fluviicola sp. TaxID=463303 RepID=UPI0025F119B7|nr:SH3 domain-containing protein [uncultured Fluviicola sp.]
MKKFLSLILILSASVPFYAQDESETISTDVYDFESWTRDWYEPLKEAVVFADACKLRSEPTSGSEMLAKLLIGDKVKILKVAATDTTINGITSNWIQVESGKKRGYVWGGLLTNQSLKVSDTTSAVWGLTKIVKGNDTMPDKYFASVRIFSRRQIRKQAEFEVTYGDQPGHAELIMIKNPLIEGVEHVFIYSTMSEACGVAWSQHYLMETRNGINYLDVGYGMSDGGIFYSGIDFVFPTKEKEKDYMIPYHRKPDANQYLKITDHGEYDENCVWTEHTTVESFEFKEGEIIPFCRE